MLRLGGDGQRDLSPRRRSACADRKMAHVEATGATTVVTANPGCILQLAAGLRARGRDAEVLHVVEVLDRAYAAATAAKG